MPFQTRQEQSSFWKPETSGDSHGKTITRSVGVCSVQRPARAKRKSPPKNGGGNGKGIGAGEQVYAFYRLAARPRVTLPKDLACFDSQMGLRKSRICTRCALAGVQCALVSYEKIMRQLLRQLPRRLERDDSRLGHPALVSWF